jgi:hypothetical protein
MQQRMYGQEARGRKDTSLCHRRVAGVDPQCSVVLVGGCDGQHLRSTGGLATRHFHLDHECMAVHAAHCCCPQRDSIAMAQSDRWGLRLLAGCRFQRPDGVESICNVHVAPTCMRHKHADEYVYDVRGHRTS